MPDAQRITPAELDTLRDLLYGSEAKPGLIGRPFDQLSLPLVALKAFEPSQIGTIVGTLMDALIPHLADLPDLGLTKHEGTIGDREGYPDYRHASGKRLELKLVYVDNPALVMKKPPTPREPSARLTQKVTKKNVDAANDALLVLAYQLRPRPDRSDAVSPTVVDLAVLSMIEVIEARDKRMEDSGGKWFGHYETPTVLSKQGRAKLSRGEVLDTSAYGRKESEGRDYNEDTNFGKLKRIPPPGLRRFLAKFRLDTTKEEDDPGDTPPRVNA